MFLICFIISYFPFYDYYVFGLYSVLKRFLALWGACLPETFNMGFYGFLKL